MIALPPRTGDGAQIMIKIEHLMNIYFPQLKRSISNLLEELK